MAECKFKVEDMKQMEYKAALFDIISEEVEGVGEEGFAQFYGFVLGVTCAYESWERDIHEFK